MGSTISQEFEGNERFRIQRRLGAGGFGVVYEAFDKERNAVVALKTLLNADAGALYRLKQEFRVLADISHPNLVNRHELLSVGDQWLITMELIDGVNFLAYVGDRRSGLVEATIEATHDPESDASDSDQTMIETMDSDHPLSVSLSDPRAGLGGPPTPASVVVTDNRPDLSVNMSRLVESLRQLGLGLGALHNAGKLHRDLKPPNVLVTREGRVVLLDFGLAIDVKPVGPDRSVSMAGTPSYMSPEQLMTGDVTPASDWYAVGMMLYEALTGRQPFIGHYSEIIEQKRSIDPPPPGRAVAGVPAYLNELCHALLQRDPLKRPSGADVLELLHLQQGQAPEVRPARPPSRDAVFIGRQQQIGELESAYQRAKEGRAVTVLVHGISGMGKTTLVRQFLTDLQDREPDAVVLAGRCFEREMVPYKALDSLVDSLTQHLRSLPDPDAAALLPADVLLLARLFPVLERVKAVSAAKRRTRAVSDSRELRRRGFAALRQLLDRIAAEQPLVLFIDDLHWSDADSAVLLADLFSPPDPPASLLIVSYRTDEAHTSPALEALMEQHQEDGGASEVMEVVVGEMTADEGREFVDALMDDADESLAANADTIASESGGNPFFLRELVSYSIESAAGDPAGLRSGRSIQLEDVLAARIGNLSEKPRRLLEVLSVAAKPIPMSIAAAAADLGEAQLDALGALHAAHLIRTRNTRWGEGYEAYHGRITSAVVAGLDEDRTKTHHLNLAHALEATGSADPEALTDHFRGAGDAERAGKYAVQAAEQAAAALAFNRAAEFYRLALDMRAGSDAETNRLRVALGDALVNAGRGTEAASVYQDAAAHAEAAEALELRRRAAQHLLMNGRLGEGREVLLTVLSELGMKLAASPKRALLSVIRQRLWLRLRGYRYVERPEREVPADDLLKIDTCWAVSVGMGLVDTMHGADFQARQLLMALRAGEPYRLARALSLETAYSALGGSKSEKQTDALISLTGALVKRVDQPLASGYATMNTGIASYLRGSWRKGLELCDRARSTLSENCTGVAWELDTCDLFGLGCLLYMGDLNELRDRLPDLLDDARARGDLFIATYLVNEIQSRLFLADGQPDAARSAVEDAIAQWHYEGFHRQHHYALHANVEILLYEGRGQAALDLIDEQFPALQRSLILRMQAAHIRVMDYRARSAVVAAGEAAGEATRKSLLGRAAQDAAAIRKDQVPWGIAVADLLEACIAASRGEDGDAVRCFAAAESMFETTDMQLHAAVARRQRGALIGGDEGDRHLQETETWLASCGVADPARLAGALAPIPKPH